MRIPVAPEGWWVIGILFLAAIIVPMIPFLGWARWLLWPLAIFSVTFFRDPERTLPAGEQRVLSPADGTIVRVDEVDEPSFFKGGARRICIFMSPFNCHINRVPVSGRITYRKYDAGTFDMAWRDKASELNEQNTVGIENERCKVLVRQIAGFLARRIVCRVKEGDVLQRGERFGLIQFGSRVDVFLPLEVAVLVKVKEAVKGGLTVLGDLP